MKAKYSGKSDPRIWKMLSVTVIGISLLACQPALGQRRGPGGGGGDIGGGGGGGRSFTPSGPVGGGGGGGRDFTPSRPVGGGGGRDFTPSRPVGGGGGRVYIPSRPIGGGGEGYSGHGRIYGGGGGNGYTPQRTYNPSPVRSNPAPDRGSYLPSSKPDSQPGHSNWQRSWQSPDRSPQRTNINPTRDNPSVGNRQIGTGRNNYIYPDTRPNFQHGRDNAGPLNQPADRRIANDGTLKQLAERRIPNNGNARNHPIGVFNRNSIQDRGVAGGRYVSYHAYNIFTHSREGRLFNNGVYLRPADRIHNTLIVNFFGGGDYCYYPYYSPVYTPGVVYYSPYYYYDGVCPPYIEASFCWYHRPAFVYIETPIYVDGVCEGYPSDGYYLQADAGAALANQVPGLQNAIDNIRKAFMESDIQPLVDLTDPNVKIAVFQRGKYEYSLGANDYLDLTRDALTHMDTISFTLDRVKKNGVGVYTVSGKQIYVDSNNQQYKVYVSYVLQRIDGRWIITQVGSSPG